MTHRRIEAARTGRELRIRVPPSKSLTHRALVAAALAEGPSRLENPLVADDTKHTARGLEQLGVSVDMTGESWLVDGCGDRLRGGGELFLGESGTTMRFLTAVGALAASPSILDGAPRLHERPMEELLRGLEQLGARIDRGASVAGLPLRVGGALPHGGRVSIPAGRSSQFASALLLVGARLPRGLELELEPPIASGPYIEVTARLLEEFGVPVVRTDGTVWRVQPARYPGTTIRIEGDYSSASYLLAATALLGGRLRLDGLRAESAQPDARFVSILEGFGCTTIRSADGIELQASGRIPAFRLEMPDAPDLVPTVAILAPFADGPSSIDGISHLRFKESDRVEMLVSNLQRLGCSVRATEDRLEFEPCAENRWRGATIATAGDHRMAMAFAVVGLRVPGVVIDDPTCVTKSNPGFWDQLASYQS